MIREIITAENAQLLEAGKARVLIKRIGHKDRLGIYVEDQLVFNTGADCMDTYSACASALLAYMNSY